MKKSTYTVILLALSLVYFASCKKSIHCTCTFNNKVVYTEDLGLDYPKNAQEKCSSYDSTVTGEAWNCKIY
jgi:hypothetical protein